MATVRNPNQHGSVDEPQIAAFESRLGIGLPADYRQFLMAHNGGEIVPDEIVLPGQVEPFASMGRFFGLHDGPHSLDAVHEMVEDTIPPDLLAFGEDAGGNLLCIGIRGGHTGRVFFWDHHRSSPGLDEPGWSGMTVLAESFDLFVAALGRPQPGAVG